MQGRDAAVERRPDPCDGWPAGCPCLLNSGRRSNFSSVCSRSFSEWRSHGD